MNLASISENRDIEKRISITPEIAKKYISLGFNINLPLNYASHLGFSNDEYKSEGVSLLENDQEVINNSEVLIQLGLPNEEKLSLLNAKHTLIG